MSLRQTTGGQALKTCGDDRIMLSSEYYNLPRWNGHESPFYEVYYLKLNEPSLGVALWLRYTLLAQTDKTATASLWAIFSDSKDHRKNIALKETISAKDVIFKKGQFHLNIGGALLDNESANGGVENENGKIAWDLKWRSSENVYRPYLRPLYLLPWPKSKVVVPNLKVYAGGHFSVNGLKFDIQNMVLHQGHVWGKRYSNGWAWADCGLFNEDKNAVLDIISNRNFGYGFLRDGDNETKFRLKGRYSLTGWEFEGVSWSKKVRGKILAAKENIVGVSYDGPLGEKRYCYNTNMADAVIDVMEKINKRWMIKTQLTSYGTTAFETVEEHPIQAFRLML